MYNTTFKVVVVVAYLQMVAILGVIAKLEDGTNGKLTGTWRKRSNAENKTYSYMAKGCSCKSAGGDVK